MEYNKKRTCFLYRITFIFNKNHFNGMETQTSSVVAKQEADKGCVFTVSVPYVSNSIHACIHSCICSLSCSRLVSYILRIENLYYIFHFIISFCDWTDRVRLKEIWKFFDYTEIKSRADAILDGVCLLVNGKGL